MVYRHNRYFAVAKLGKQTSSNILGELTVYKPSRKKNKANFTTLLNKAKSIFAFNVRKSMFQLKIL